MAPPISLSLFFARSVRPAFGGGR